MLINCSCAIWPLEAASKRQKSNISRRQQQTYFYPGTSVFDRFSQLWSSLMPAKGRLYAPTTVASLTITDEGESNGHFDKELEKPFARPASMLETLTLLVNCLTFF